VLKAWRYEPNMEAGAGAVAEEPLRATIARRLFCVRRHIRADGSCEWYVLNGHTRRAVKGTFKTRAERGAPSYRPSTTKTHAAAMQKLARRWGL
jgi:hypothetical protein